jgi:hypothetical protein
MGACGGNGPSHHEGANRPFPPPPGWRTVRNHRAGFTLAIPRRWTARTRRGATLVRSSDRLVAVSVAADRSADGRSTEPARYARELVDELPDFEGNVDPLARRIRGTPYRTARVEGSGTLKTSRRPQRLTVAVYQRPGAVTFAAVVFRNPDALASADGRLVERMLRTLRAGQP